MLCFVLLECWNLVGLHCLNRRSNVVVGGRKGRVWVKAIIFRCQRHHLSCIAMGCQTTQPETLTIRSDPAMASDVRLRQRQQQRHQQQQRQAATKANNVILNSPANHTIRRTGTAAATIVRTNTNIKCIPRERLSRCRTVALLYNPLYLLWMWTTFIRQTPCTTPFTIVMICLVFDCCMVW